MENAYITPAENSESPSSVSAEATNSDSQELLLNNENLKEGHSSTKVEGKERRLNRRIALALARSQQTCPTPSPSIGKLKNSTIDLTTEDDDPINKWFKNTFAKHQPPKKSTNAKESFAVPHDIPKNVPKSLKTGAVMKKRLEASMAIKRQKGLEQRRQMYDMDNEHLKTYDNEEDDEEEEEIKKRKKKKVPRKINASEYDSEDDEDYKEEKSPASSESEDNDADTESLKNQKKSDQREDDEMSVNLLDDSFTYDVFNKGPASVISGYNPRNDEPERADVFQLPSVSQNDSQTDDFGDILSLCSGKFGSTQIEIRTQTEHEFVTSTQIDINNDHAVQKDVSDDENEEESENLKTKKKINRVLDSDDEDEPLAAENAGNEQLAETVPLEEENEVEIKTTKRRVVVSDDDEEDEKDEEDGAGEGVEEAEEDEAGQSEGEEEADEQEEENQEDEEEEEAPNFDDEDDELAVIKRIEYQEYKTKSKKKNYFDDEASLSGDDVGSDIDDEDNENNEYEAEEGDADDVPDADTIRRQNHKLLLKQENDKEQRALFKLQDKLLADGDLGGMETNRQFRFRIREEENGQIHAENTEIIEEEDEEVEEDDEKRAERAKMLKFRIEKADEFLMLEEPKRVNDPFERAARLVKSTKEVTGVSNEVEDKKKKKVIEKPSLLKKTALATTFQEVLVNANSAAPKQMYVRNYNLDQAGSSSSITNQKPSGTLKRGRDSPIKDCDVKRNRQSKLSALE